MGARRDRMVTTGRAGARLRSLAPTARSTAEAVQVVVRSLIAGLHCPPTPLTELFPRLAVTGSEPADIPISGELRRTKRGLTIVYSQHLLPSARRFTIAHELGHAVFERTGPGCPRRGKEVERLCDEIAAEILMPTDVLRRSLVKPLELEGIFRLSRDYETSLMSTAIRISQLLDVTLFAYKGSELIWAFGPERDKSPRDLGRESEMDAKHGGGSRVFFFGGRKASSFHRLEWTTRGSITLYLLAPVGDQREVVDRVTKEDLRTYLATVIPD